MALFSVYNDPVSDVFSGSASFISANKCVQMTFVFGFLCFFSSNVHLSLILSPASDLRVFMQLTQAEKKNTSRKLS